MRWILAAALATILGGPAAAQTLGEAGIAAIQDALAADGYDPGPARGTWSEASAAALKAYQSDWRIEATGAPDPEMLARLKRRHPATMPQWHELPLYKCRVWNKAPQAHEDIDWTGNCHGGKPGGRGTMTWVWSFMGEDVHESYEGIMRDGLFDGRGRKQWAGGSVYDGGWRAGKFHGRGTMSWANGERYRGEWRNGARDGRGVHDFLNGNRYNGAWRDGLPSGRGTLSRPDGMKYSGEWRTGEWHGHGTYTMADGGKYTGSFVDGAIEGNGSFTWSNGDIYLGDWKNNRIHGQGIKTWADGTVYGGAWQDNMPHGEGTAETAEGLVYTGTWEKGCLRGGGKQAWLNTTREACGY